MSIYSIQCSTETFSSLFDRLECHCFFLKQVIPSETLTEALPALSPRTLEYFHIKEAN